MTNEEVLVKCPNGHGEPHYQHFDYCGMCPECGSRLIPAPLDRDAIRNAALEEAAKSILFLDEECTGPEMMLKAVQKIRALKTKEGEQS